MEGCPENWSRQGEFVILEECLVPVLPGQILDIVTICEISILLLIMLVIGWRLGGLHEKPIFNRILIYSTVIQAFLMALLPTLNLLGFFPANLWVGEIIHVTAAGMANIPIAFVYIELRILSLSSIKTRGNNLRPIRIVLLCLDITQTALFLLGPPLCYFTGISPHMTFWVVVLLIDFIVIPLFCFFGISIYRRIRQLKTDEYDKFSRQILISIIVCGILGMVTATMSILAIIFREMDWLFLRICWLAAIIFDGLVFGNLMYKK